MPDAHRQSREPRDRSFMGRSNIRSELPSSNSLKIQIREKENTKDNQRVSYTIVASVFKRSPPNLSAEVAVAQATTFVTRAAFEFFSLHMQSPGRSRAKRYYTPYPKQLIYYPGDLFSLLSLDSCRARLNEPGCRRQAAVFFFSTVRREAVAIPTPSAALG